MNYLVSYNHSGNTWVRYCVEYVTKRPTHGHRIFSVSERANNILNINTTSKPVLLKRHEIKKGEITSNDNFILLLRHPTECIKENQNEIFEFAKYYFLIDAYENHSGEKSVYYFKNLFDKKTIYDIIIKCSVIVDNDRMTDLFNNWDFHKKQSLSMYQNKTNVKGHSLLNIPKKLLEHELIKKCNTI